MRELVSEREGVCVSDLLRVLAQQTLPNTLHTRPRRVQEQIVVILHGITKSLPTLLPTDFLQHAFFLEGACTHDKRGPAQFAYRFRKAIG